MDIFENIIPCTIDIQYFIFQIQNKNNHSISLLLSFLTTVRASYLSFIQNQLPLILYKILYITTQECVSTLSLTISSHDNLLPFTKDTQIIVQEHYFPQITFRCSQCGL